MPVYFTHIWKIVIKQRCTSVHCPVNNTEVTKYVAISQAFCWHRVQETSMSYFLKLKLGLDIAELSFTVNHQRSHHMNSLIGYRWTPTKESLFMNVAENQPLFLQLLLAKSHG